MSPDRTRAIGDVPVRTLMVRHPSLAPVWGRFAPGQDATADSPTTERRSLSLPTLARELIEHILTQLHDTHRRDWPATVALARELESQGLRPTLADELDALARAQERHMCEEEARLFPLMERGGQASIAHLIGTMRAEHLTYAAAAARLEGRLATLSASAGRQPQVTALCNAVRRLFQELTQHMQLEEEVLFPMFLHTPRPSRERPKHLTRRGWRSG